jgi:hypothetical protein
MTDEQKEYEHIKWEFWHDFGSEKRREMLIAIGVITDKATHDLPQTVEMVLLNAAFRDGKIPELKRLMKG